jgi:soluble lytic murein transglycosylase-like protein
MVCAICLLLLLPLSSSASQYDRLIERSANTFMPSIDWRLWKAQVKAESAFKHDAVSPVGAMGLSQIMPQTFKEIAEKSGIKGNVFDPEINLMRGSWYMARMRNIFKAPRPDRERHNLAMASYNAGAGHIIKAQQLAGNPAEWQPVADKLHLVTGKHAEETRNYVTKINRYYRVMLISGE